MQSRFRWSYKLCWLSDEQDLLSYLKAWRAAPLTYIPSEPRSGIWKQDAHTISLGHDTTGRLFDAAADLLMRYRFYPPSVMTSVGDFDLENRWMRPGDRLMLCIHVFPVMHVNLLNVLAMNEVYEVIDTIRLKRIAYVTTATHAEVGEWSAQVEWQQSGTVTLSLQSISRTSPQLPAWQKGIARLLQKRAHQLGMAHFAQQALDKAAARPGSSVLVVTG